MAHILVVEDNNQIREVIASYLKLEGHQVREAPTLAKAKNIWARHKLDLIILDIMLPDGDGFQFAKSIKKDLDIPLIFVTARTSESDRITGLELGADDYLVKPFSVKELVLRVRALLKRLKPTQALNSQTNSQTEIWQLNQNKLKLNRAELSLAINNREIKLTAGEWKILLYLIDNALNVVPRVALLKHCLNYNLPIAERTIDTHIKNLRAKLGNKDWIETVRSFGYRFKGQAAS